jgi:hypothetical protein
MSPEGGDVKTERSNAGTPTGDKLSPLARNNDEDFEGRNSDCECPAPNGVSCDSACSPELRKGINVSIAESGNDTTIANGNRATRKHQLHSNGSTSNDNIGNKDNGQGNPVLRAKYAPVIERVQTAIQSLSSSPLTQFEPMVVNGDSHRQLTVTDNDRPEQPDKIPTYFASGDVVGSNVSSLTSLPVSETSSAANGTKVAQTDNSTDLHSNKIGSNKVDVQESLVVRVSNAPGTR